LVSFSYFDVVPALRYVHADNFLARGLTIFLGTHLQGMPK